MIKVLPITFINFGGLLMEADWGDWEQFNCSICPICPIDYSQSSQSSQSRVHLFASRCCTVFKWIGLQLVTFFFTPPHAIYTHVSLLCNTIFLFFTPLQMFLTCAHGPTPFHSHPTLPQHAPFPYSFQVIPSNPNLTSHTRHYPQLLTACTRQPHIHFRRF